MKRTLLILFVFLSALSLKAQEISFAMGTNFSQFHLKNPDYNVGTPLQKGTGTFYEIAYLLPSQKEKLRYHFGLGVNEYNALAGNSVNLYRWNTKYLGLKSGIEYEFDGIGNIKIVPLAGVHISSILYGKQELDGMVYDLKDNSDFTGIKLIPYLGIKLKYPIQDLGYLSVGYNCSSTLRASLTSNEHLTIINNQIVFGIHFNVKN